MISRFEKFIYNITEIDLYWHRLATGVMKEYGLKGNHAVYFTALRTNADGLTSAELAVTCGKDKADVSRDIAVLEKAGLVVRCKQGSGVYRARIILTEQGNDLAEKVARKAETAVSLIGGDLDETERMYFYSAMEKIVANMKNLKDTDLSDR